MSSSQWYSFAMLAAPDWGALAWLFGVGRSENRRGHSGKRDGMRSDKMRREGIEKIVLPKGRRGGIIGAIIVLWQYGDSVWGVFF